MQRKIFRILKEKFNIPEKELEEARKLQTEKRVKIGEVLIRKKLITEAGFLEALAGEYNLPFMPVLSFDKIDDDFSEIIPIQFLKKNLIVPLTDKQDSSYIIAVNDPAQFQPIDDLAAVLKADKVKIVISAQSEILAAINATYDFKRDSAEKLVQNLEESEDISVEDIKYTADILDDTSDAPIIKLVNQIISQAVKTRASDIHIEPYQDGLKIRNRIDGILYNLLSPPKWIQSALTSRIKVMAHMNIAEKRLPQDGRIDIKIGEQDIDVRVSTIPTAFGERVVLRLLNKSGTLLQLSEIGFDDKELAMVKELIGFPHGIVLVTGPTGSGKTTTLYAALSTINKPDVNIITIEDPIEYQLEGISQIQVNPKINLTFAKGLRSIVRQDPDVILIGEIRDKETAEIAVQSALTGHLVFSTLHTNDSASVVARLVDMGVEPFLISSSVVGIMAQRLVRILCKHCKEEYTPDKSVSETLGLEKIETPLYRAKGCEKCFKTGFSGRMGVFEIMSMSDSLKSLILKTWDSNMIKKQAITEKMRTLKQAAVSKVLKGLIPVEEVIRVTRK